MMNKAMKYSGVEWLGKIPHDWEVLKAKRIFKLKNEKNSELKPLLSVSKGRGLLLREEMVNRPTHAQKNIEAFKLVGDGDFVIHLRSFQSGFELSSIEGAVSPAYTVFNARKNDEVCNKYYKYIFYSKPFIDKIASTTLSLRDGKPISYDEFSITLLPVPNYIEQQKIAAFLDEKVAHIDNIIEDTKKSIENLKAYKQSLITETVTKGLNPDVEMKDSGIEWVGKIPKHWQVVKMKRLGTVRNGLTYKPTDIVDATEGILVLRSGNIQDSQLTFKDNIYVNTEIKENLRVNKGDILICSRNGSRKLIGKNAIINDDIEATFGAFMMLFKPHALSIYIYYILNSEVFNFYLGTFLTSTINQLTKGNFENMEVVYSPDIEEQKRIAVFLEENVNGLNTIINEKKKLIEELESYKKSLIYEYVTGKKEVK